MRASLGIAVLLGLTSCGKIIFGSGHLFLWNGTPGPVELVVDGRSSGAFRLSSHTGERLDDAVAGSYNVTWGAAKASSGARFELKPDATVVVNVASASCFVRSDISGMYQSGRERVRLLQKYDRGEFLVFDQEIPVMPGERPPASRPKSAYAFQRLSDVPCELLRDEAGMAEFVRKAH
jgi:hypothetical protein